MLVMILADGETFTELKGCAIADIPIDADDNDVKGRGYPIVAEFEPSVDGNGIFCWVKRTEKYYPLTLFQSVLSKGT